MYLQFIVLQFIYSSYVCEAANFLLSSFGKIYDILITIMFYLFDSSSEALVVRRTLMTGEECMYVER